LKAYSGKSVTVWTELVWIKNISESVKVNQSLHRLGRALRVPED